MSTPQPRPRRRPAAVRALAIIAALLALGLTAGPAAAQGAGRAGGTGAYPGVVRQAAPGLPGYTLYRPLSVRAHERLPLVAFATGGCFPTNDQFIAFLSLVAARGFVIVANGAVNAHLTPNQPLGLPHPHVLTRVIEWAVSHQRHHGPLVALIDTSKFAVTGQSCGGWDALLDGSDRRVKSVIAFNGGFFPTDLPGVPYSGDRAALARLHTPTLFVEGGPTDIAYANTIQSYEAVPTRVPAVLAQNATAGHTGLYDPFDGAVIDQTVTLTANWLRFTLDHRRSARAFFIGPHCGLCTTAGWTVRSKGF
jgi:hypothetical protein